jgi:hypothetical protein
MASIISAGTTSGTALNMAGDTSGQLQLATNGSTTALTIDTSQKVGIGTASPNTKLHVVATGTGNCARLESASGPNLAFAGTETSGRTYLIGEGLVTAGNFSVYDNNAAAERFVINSSGYVGIGNGTASLGYLLDITTPTASLVTSRLARMPSDSAFALGFRNGVTGGISGTEIGRMNWSYAGTDNAYISAERNGGTGANRINVVCNMSAGVFLAAGGTSWGSLSDERQKTNLEPIADASNKLNTLRTVTGRYITDEETVSRAFLIAQDVQKVLPQAVDTQENEEGTLGLRYTDLIPLLIAGFKEQQTLIVSQSELINSLTARVTALEAK